MHASHPDRNIRLLSIYWLLRDFQLWIPVWIVFLTIDRGFSLTQVTLAEGVYLIGVLVLEVPTGAVADKYGRSKSMALGAAFLAVSVLIFAFTSTFAILIGSFLLWSVASALMSGADMALLFDTLKAAGREAQYEKLAGRGIALEWTGVGIATLLGGPVAALTSTSFTIFFGAATCLVTMAAALAIWEPPRDGKAGAREPYWSSIGASFGEAWRAVDVRILIVLAGTAFAALESIHYLIQPFLLDRGIEVGAWFSLLQVPLLVAGLGGALVADRVMAKVGVKALLIGPLVGGAAYLVLAAAPGLVAYAPMLLVVGASSVVEPIATGYINRRIGSERRATVLSIVSMFRSLVLAFFAPLLGYATDQWGIAEAFAIGGIMAFASALIFGIPFVLRAHRDRVTLLAAVETSAAG